MRSEPAPGDLAPGAPVGPGALVREVRASAVGRGTHAVPDVRRLVDGALATAFPHRVWVLGRVADARPVPGDGLHFALRAALDDDEPLLLACHLAADALPQVAEVLDRVHDADVDDVVAVDRLARVGGLLRYDPLRATLVLQVSELDPAPTARGLAEQREQVRALAVEHGLPGRQRARHVRRAPLSVSLLGSDDDPAVAQAAALLAGSPYAVELREVGLPLHGVEAVSAVAAAVHEAALRSDVVLLVRGPGRPLARSVFDTPEVVRAVGEAPVPVVAGLGGDTPTVTDDVAHTSVPGAAEAAGWVLDRLAEAQRALHALVDEAHGLGQAVLVRARNDLDARREEVAAAAAEAAERAGRPRARQRVLALAVAGGAVVALVAAAVLTGQPLVLLGLVGVAVLLGAAVLWSVWSTRRGSGRMSQQDEEFTQVMVRLQEVRDELARTASPETVHRLRALADELVARGEQVLGRA